MTEYKDLIQPISDEHPCGINVRQDNELSKAYFEIKELRNELRREERKNIEVDNNLFINKEGWEPLVTSISKILAIHTKDIEIVAWLIEGLTRTKQFEGLSVGLQIICDLFDKYPKHLHPIAENISEEDEDFHPQLTAISMLGGKYEIGTLIAPIYFCELIKTKNGNSYNGWELKKILKSSGKNQPGKDVTKDDIVQCEELKLALDDLDSERFLKIKEQINSCINSFKQLNKILTVRFERKAPNLTNLNDALGYCFSIISSIAKINDVQVEQKLDKLGDTNSGADSLFKLEWLENLSPKKLNKPAAIKLLEILVTFFAESEPHSPISYNLARTLSWSKMSLPEILSDILSDQARNEYCKYSGVPFLEKEYKED